MPKYRIVFAPTAKKQLLRLDKKAQIRIARAIAKLGDDPYLGKALKGELQEYRSYRVGNYRVIYYLRQKKIQVEIIRIAHRRDVYRK